MPDAMLAIWRQFLEVHAWRGTFPLETVAADKKTRIIKFVPNQMSLAMINAWSQLSTTRLGPFELAVFSKLEAVFWKVYQGKAAAREVDSQFLTKNIATQLRAMKSPKAIKESGGMRTLVVKSRPGK